MLAADLDVHELARQQLVEAVRYGRLLDARTGRDIGDALVASLLQELQDLEPSIAGKGSEKRII